jgi:hypothetical protein
MAVSSSWHHGARLLAGLVILLAAHLLLRGYVTDDTYIHLRYAENLASRGEFSFNPGESTYGATSPLWILGLVALFGLGITGPAATWVLGLLSGMLTLVILAGLLRRLDFPESWRWWLFLLAGIDAWFLRWTMSGMETPLATASLLVLLWPLVMRPAISLDPERPGRLWPRYLAWGVAAGLAGLVRPEWLLLAPFALPWLLLAEYREADMLAGSRGRYQARPHAPALAAAGGWLLVVGPWLVYAQHAFGRFVPGTATAKSYDPAGGLGEILASFGRSFQQLGMTQGVLWLGLAALMVFVLVQRRRQDEQPDDAPETEDPTPGEPGAAWRYWPAVTLVLIAATWTVLLLGGYAINRVWTISRYLCPLSPVLLLAMGVVAFWLLHFTSDYRGRPWLGRWLAGTVCALALLGNIALSVVLVRPHARAFAAGVIACYLEKGQWIGEHSPPGAVIAALDIGALAYGSDRKVLDLMGLVSPEIMAIGRQAGFQEMVASGLWLRPDLRQGPVPEWFVDRWLGPPRWQDQTIHGVHFELVDTCALGGVGLREPEAWTVALYRLREVAAD